MKHIVYLTLTWILLGVGCSPHFHIDLLGKEQIEEVTLLESKAREKILLLDVEGIIGLDPSPGFFEKEGNVLSRIYYRLEKASEDPDIRGIILRLDTPGGEVTASDILHNEVLDFKNRTGIPVVALMMGLAASGGYYIASGCDYIVAHPSTITGSIGVVAVFPNLEDLFTKIGVKFNIIKSGRLKDSGSTFRDLSEEERGIFQDIIDDFHQKFLETVQTGRHELIVAEKLDKIADGRVYTASQALELRLIDEIGYFDSALEKTLSLARINQARVVSYTYFPHRRTNIYASKLNNISYAESSHYQKILQSLKSGFYYLWLPQILD